MDWGIHYSSSLVVLVGYFDADWVSGSDEINTISAWFCLP